MIFAAIIMVIFGIVMIVRPKMFYDLTESWKSHSYGEPSSLYIFSTRFGGVCVTLAGIGYIVVQFIE